MSSVLAVSVRRLAVTAPLSSQRIVSNAAVTAFRSSFSTTPTHAKTTAEVAKDTLKSVDRAVSDKLVDGINAGATIKNKVKEAGEDIIAGKATPGKKTADKAMRQASGKLSDLRDEAMENAGQAADKAKSMASEATDKVQDAANEAKKKME